MMDERVVVERSRDEEMGERERERELRGIALMNAHTSGTSTRRH